MTTLMLTPRDLMTAASAGDVQGVRDGISWFLELPAEMRPIQEAIQHLLQAVERSRDAGSRAAVLESLVQAIYTGIKMSPDREFLLRCIFGPPMQQFYANLWSRLLFKATDIAAGMSTDQARVQPLVLPARSFRAWFETVDRVEWREHGWFGQVLEDFRDLLIGLTSFLAAMGPGQVKLEALDALGAMIGELGLAQEPEQAVSVLRWVLDSVSEKCSGEPEKAGGGFERFLAQGLHLDQYPSALRLEELLVARAQAPLDSIADVQSRDAVSSQ
ncbi:MAG: hypothetical protein AB1714_13025 [Acidobacteriota bacterium]